MQCLELSARNAKTLRIARERLLRNPPTNSQLHICERSSASGGTFSPEEYFATLQTQQIGAVLLRASTLTSTSECLFGDISSFLSGTVCICDEQSAGRGRGENLWQAPRGALAFSFVCSTKLASYQIPLLQYISTIAVVQALKDICFDAGCDNFEKLRVRIKWPNDVYYKTSKIGGVLCKTKYEDSAFTSVVGIGLNLHNTFPTICVNELIRENIELFNQHDAVHNAPKACTNREYLPQVKREVIVARILEHFERLQKELEENGFPGVRNEYISHWMHSGSRVSVSESLNNANSNVQLTITGLTDMGMLTAVDAYGNMFELQPDGNSLDFLAGMIRKKIL